MTQMNPNMPANAGVPTNGPIAGAGYDKLGDELTDGDSRPDTTAGTYDDAVNDLVPDEVSDNSIDAPGTEDTPDEAAQAPAEDAPVEDAPVEDAPAGGGLDEGGADVDASAGAGTFDSTPLPGIKAGDGEDPDAPRIQRVPSS